MIKTTIVSLIVISALYGCSVQKSIHYSYTVDRYFNDSIKHFLSSSSLISYGNYLFEFRKKTSMITMIHGESDSVTHSVEIDTIGVYLLGNKNKLYYEFDTFALKNKIVKTGKLTDKELGVRFKLSDKNTDANLFYSLPKEVLINNIKCYYAEVLSKNKNTDDTIKIKMTLIKNSNLNSLYKINGVKFTDENYCIIGLNMSYPKPKEEYSEEINAMRPLTKREKIICESMVLKSKNYVEIQIPKK